MDLVTCPLVGLPTQPQDDSQRQQEQRGPGSGLLKFRQVLRVEGRPRHDTAAASPAERRLQPPSARLKCCVLDHIVVLFSRARRVGSPWRPGPDKSCEGSGSTRVARSAGTSALFNLKWQTRTCPSLAFALKGAPREAK